MKWPLAMALVLAGWAFPPPLDAQFRAGPRSIASSPVRIFAGSTGVRAASFGSRYARFGGAPRRHNQTSPVFPGTSCLTNPSYSGSFFCREFFPSRGVSFGLPASGFYIWYPPTDYQPVEETPAAVPEQEIALAAQVQRLADEVELLREDQASPQELRPPVVAPPAAAVEKPLSTFLVYRDGHQREVQNYAILGQTLWVFADQATRRISLADLDLEATRKLNDERGVEFISADLR